MKLNIKNLMAIATLLTLGSGVVSCGSDDDPKVETANLMYLSTTDNLSIVESSDAVINVKVELTRPVDAAASFDFKISGDELGALTIENNPLTIAAGSRQGTITIKSLKKDLYREQTAMTLEITNLDASKYELKENIHFFLVPSFNEAGLTPEQQALVDGYKSKLGIDLTPWMGAVSLEGKIEFPGGGNTSEFEEPKTITLSGNTSFTLSASADADNIVLSMVNNPMGMANYLYESFRKMTIEDTEYFANVDAGASYELMQLLNWNTQSNETFNVILDNLKITDYNASTRTAKVEFVTEGINYAYDKDGNKIYCDALEDYLTYTSAESRVAFEYTYSAWDRMLDLIAEKNPSIIELMPSCTSSPASQLGISGILEDEWEIDEADGVNLYVEPTGTIDFGKGELSFCFPFDHNSQTGYSRVTVKYTLAK